MPKQLEDKQKILARVRRIKGQFQSIDNALEANLSCSAILQQICAVRGAINGLMNELLEVHLKDTLVSGEDPEGVFLPSWAMKVQAYLPLWMPPTT